MWSDRISRLKQGCPVMDYPDIGCELVLMGGICGLGHRLIRNGKIYHRARSAGFRVGVFWFPFEELFSSEPDLFARPDDRKFQNRFTNEPGNIRVVRGLDAKSSVIKNSDKQSEPYLNFDILSHSNLSHGWRQVFEESSKDYLINFYICLLERLRENWIEEIEQFLQKYRKKELVGLHMRTGNGETGDFTIKKRGISKQAILDNFLEHLGTKADPADVVIFVATDDPSVYAYLNEYSEFPTARFTQFLPEKGIVTGNMVSEKEFDEIDNEQRVRSFYESFVDMCMLGFCRDLHVSAYSSFVVGSCIFNRLGHSNCGTIRIFDSKTQQWQLC